MGGPPDSTKAVDFWRNFSLNYIAVVLRHRKTVRRVDVLSIMSSVSDPIIRGKLIHLLDAHYSPDIVIIASISVNQPPV